MRTVASRSLWPREHGAYAQLGAPLLTSLLLGLPSLPALSLAFAACLAFVANEPLLVVLGHRGARIRATHGTRARTLLAVTAVGAAVFGAIGLLAASPPTLAIAGLTMVPAGGLVACAWLRREHSLAGELLAAVALPGAAAPVAVASGLNVPHAIAIWCAWSVGYACSVAAVHRVLARHRRPVTVVDRVLFAALVGVIGGTVAIATVAPVALVALPLAAIATILVLRPPAARRLRAVGVALVLASALASVVELLAIRV